MGAGVGGGHEVISAALHAPAVVADRVPGGIVAAEHRQLIGVSRRCARENAAERDDCAEQEPKCGR